MKRKSLTKKKIVKRTNTRKRRKNPGEWDEEDGTRPELNISNISETKERVLRYLNKTKINYSGENHESWMLSFIEKIKKEITDIKDEDDISGILTMFHGKIEIMSKVMNIISYESVNDDWYFNKYER